MTMHDMVFIKHPKSTITHLSTTVKIIIIVVISVILLLLLTTILFFIRRRRRTRRQGTILRETGKGDLEFEADEELRPMVLQTGRGGRDLGEEHVRLGVQHGNLRMGGGEDMYAGSGYGQVPHGRGPILEEGQRGTEFYRNQ